MNLRQVSGACKEEDGRTEEATKDGGGGMHAVLDNQEVAGSSNNGSGLLVRKSKLQTVRVFIQGFYEELVLNGCNSVTMLIMFTYHGNIFETNGNI